MAWWTSFIQLGIDKYKEQSKANKDADRLGDDLVSLNAEYDRIDREGTEKIGGLSLQLADLRRPRESKPIHTRPGSYNKYLRGRRRGSV